MKTEKTLAQLLENIDTNYMSEFDRINAIANAKRAEAVSEAILSVTRSIKQFVVNTKNALIHVILKNQQA